MSRDPLRPPPRGSDGDGRGGESPSLLPGTAAMAVAGAAAVSAMSASTNAAAAAAGRSSRSIGASVTSDEATAERIDKLAVMIGEVADRILKDVSDRMPGLEAWTISTLDTIFAPRLVLRCVCVKFATLSSHHTPAAAIFSDLCSIHPCSRSQLYCGRGV